MIKVNLLRDQTLKVKKTTVKPEVSKTGLLLAVMFVLLVGGLGGWWWLLDRQITKLNADKERLTEQKKGLEDVQRQIDAYQKKKNERQARIDIIEKLKEGQTGPLLLLNHLNQSVPTEGNVWLTTLDQKGDQIKIKGYAAKVEYIPDFIASLQRSGSFKTVDLERYDDEKISTSFSVICTSARKGATAE